MSITSANIVITGDGGAISRMEAEGLVPRLGGNLENTVSRVCDFCVVLDNPGCTKIETAKKIIGNGGSVRIISGEEFVALVKATLR